MLETVWFSVILMLQALNAEPALAEKNIAIDVYYQSTLTYRLELNGTINEGSFYDSLSKRSYGDFELMRKATRQFGISPLVDVPKSQKTVQDSSAGGAKPVAKPTSSSTKSEEVKIPSAFFLDLSPAIRSLKDFQKQARQEFSFTAPESKTDSKETAKTSTEKTDSNSSSAKIIIEKRAGVYVLHSPEAELVLVLTIQ